MKKVFLCALVLAAGCFISCQGQTKDGEAVVDKEYVEEAPNNVEVAKPEYKIENGRIIPVNGRPMIVDFSATWCPPCRQLKPIFEKLAEEFRGRIDFVTVDVDENPSLAMEYGANSIPMMVFLNKDGQVQNTIVGFQNRDQLLAAINTYFGF